MNLLKFQLYYAMNYFLLNLFLMVKYYCFLLQSIIDTILELEILNFEYLMIL
jgi:hypothetical protein